METTVMDGSILAIVLASIVGPSIVLGLAKALGWRKGKMETEASVSTLWQNWAAEQGKRIDALEADVAELKEALAKEQHENQRLTAANRRQGSMLTDLVRWAIVLRDEVIRLGGDVPAEPVDIESALTNLGP